jgi:hypothetical protein
MEKYIKHGLKIAGFCFTAPATIAVAGALYPQADLFTWIAQASGLMLVEGVMLLGWWMLDNTPTATPAQRWLYAAMAFIGFVDLTVIAATHGEGWAGLAFRAPLLVAIVYSIVESGILADIHFNTDGARDILKDFQVRMHARKLERKEAKAERAAMHAVRIAFLDAEQQGGLHAAAKYAESLTARIDATHDAESAITHDATHTTPMQSKWDQWIDPRTAAKDDTKAAVAAVLQTEPDISSYELAKRIGKSETTARRYRKELAAAEYASAIRDNGHAAHL